MRAHHKCSKNTIFSLDFDYLYFFQLYVVPVKIPLIVINNFYEIKVILPTDHLIRPQDELKFSLGGLSSLTDHLLIL